MLSLSVAQTLAGGPFTFDNVEDKTQSGPAERFFQLLLLVWWSGCGFLEST